MTQIIIGPNTTDLKEQAKIATMKFYVGAAEADNVPPTQRVMYGIKLEEARRVIADPNYTSTLIDMEVAARNAKGENTDKNTLAVVIVSMANASFALEVQRITVGLEIEQAADTPAILAVLAKYKIPLGP